MLGAIDMFSFNSKRNNVYLKDGLVYKECETKEAAYFEKEFLEELLSKGLAVPRVISVLDTVLVLEYIEGITIPDFLEVPSSLERCTTVAKNIVDWFNSFYKAVDYTNSHIIRGDVNGRNFIITKDSIYSVDFEEKVYGNRETDLGSLLAYISNYDLIDISVRDKLHSLLLPLLSNTFNTSAKEIALAEEKEIELMKIRRKNRIQTLE